MPFSFEILAISALIFFFAAVFHGSIGTGFPMIATPLLALYTDLQTAIILTLIPTLLVNIVSIASEGDFVVAIRRHLPLALYALLGSALGTLVLISINSEFFKALLAIAILVYLLAEKIKLKLSWIRQNPKAAKLTFGISAGVLGGLTNVMAPILIIYSLESGHSKREIIQASNLCFLFGKIVQIILFSASARFTFSELSISSIMLLVTAFALTIGVAIKKRIKVEVYKKILRVLLLILAIIILLQTMF
jgi:hypothetical protein